MFHATTKSGYLDRSVFQCVTLLLFPITASVEGHLNGNKRKQPACVSLEVLFVSGFKRIHFCCGDGHSKEWEGSCVWAVRIDLMKHKVGLLHLV